MEIGYFEVTIAHGEQIIGNTGCKAVKLASYAFRGSASNPEHKMA